MARPKEVFDEDLAIRVKSAMENLRGHKLCYHLQAIASCANQPVNTVAAVMGVSSSLDMAMGGAVSKSGD